MNINKSVLKMHSGKALQFFLLNKTISRREMFRNVTWLWKPRTNFGKLLNTSKFYWDCDQPARNTNYSIRLCFLWKDSILADTQAFNRINKTLFPYVHCPHMDRKLAFTIYDHVPTRNIKLYYWSNFQTSSSLD